MVIRRIAIVLTAAILGACRGDARASAQNQAPPARGPANRAIDARRQSAIVDASAKVGPAVVSIHVILPTARQMSFFGIQEETPEGFGTGFAFRSEGTTGYIITNNHVVENATQITVTFSDGTETDGTLQGADPVTDIAVIKIKKSGMPAVTLGKSSDLMIGEWAIALGNPYAYMLGNPEPTVTAGVISATHRNIMSGGNMKGVYVGMIQTDAAINPGNSGGPLVNALGEVIGVNSSIFSNTGESVGIGFSIPIERAVRVANELIATGTVRRAWPGLEVVTPTNLSDHRIGGVQVRSVVAGGPADRAGLKVGDVLVAANGQVLRTYLDWEAVKLDLKVGDVITVSVKAGGSEPHRIIAGDLPTVTATRVQALKGMELVSVTPAVRAERNVVNQFGGALVVSIQPEIAAQYGVQRGDVIFGINQQGLRTADEVAKALAAVRAGQIFILRVERNGQDASVQRRMGP